MRLLGRVAGMTALLALCGDAACAQEPPVPKASQPAVRETPKDGDTSSADSYRKARELSEGMVLGVLEEQGLKIH